MPGNSRRSFDAESLLSPLARVPVTHDRVPEPLR